MKDKAVGSPFDDPPAEEEDAESENTAAESESQTANRDDRVDHEQVGELTNPTQHTEYPLKLRRDNVKDERDMVQLFVLDETKQRANTAKSQLEQNVGQSIYLTDFREAAYLAGLQNLDDTVAILEDWGYQFD